MRTPSAILVAGDLMLDQYTWGDASRVSPEAPVLVLRAEIEEARLGGAASVAGLLAGFGSPPIVAGVVGDDPAGRILRKLLEESGIRLCPHNGEELVFTDLSRPTTLKERFLGRADRRHPHQVLRVDRESSAPIDQALEHRLISAITAELSTLSAVLISDYKKGTCTPALLEAVICAAQARGVPVLIDPARGVDYARYRGATLIKPNRHEAAKIANRRVTTQTDAAAVGRELCRRYDFEWAVVTLDREGLVLVPRSGEWRHIAAEPREVYDVTGAGDTVLAVLGIALARNMGIIEACELANRAAGLQVERLGVAPLRWEDIESDSFPTGGNLSLPERIHEASAHHHHPAFGRAPLIGRATGARNDGPKRRGSEGSPKITALSDARRGVRLPSSSKIISLSELVPVLESLRQSGRTVVFTNGCFDILHAGHAYCLEHAATRGDVLVVGINSDASVARLKGSPRPIINEFDRMALVAALAVVDYVVLFDDDTPDEIIRAIRPDVLAKGDDYKPDQIAGRSFVERHGGCTCLVPRFLKISSTEILRRLKERIS